MSEYGTRGLIEAGTLRPVVRTPSIRLSAADVEDLRVARRDSAIEEFTRRGVDPVKLARDTRRALRPELMDPLPGGVRGLGMLPSNVRAFFGPAPLMALTMEDRETCTWCAARVAAGLLKVPEPQYGEVMHALLGDPCAEKCMRSFAGSEMERLRARVHPAGVRPAGGSTASSAAAGAVRPVRDDDGRALVARRLKETRARLKDAKRRGDQRQVIRLAAMARGLERDAAAVDGRVPSAGAARPGRLRCGHELAQNCHCPRRASRRSAR